MEIDKLEIIAKRCLSVWVQSGTIVKVIEVETKVPINQTWFTFKRQEAEKCQDVVDKVGLVWKVPGKKRVNSEGIVGKDTARIIRWEKEIASDGVYASTIDFVKAEENQVDYKTDYHHGHVPDSVLWTFPRKFLQDFIA